jgi:hypothetical protein
MEDVLDCCAPWVAETLVHLGKVQFPLDLLARVPLLRVLRDAK